MAMSGPTVSHRVRTAGLVGAACNPDAIGRQATVATCLRRTPTSPKPCSLSRPPADIPCCSSLGSMRFESQVVQLSPSLAQVRKEGDPNLVPVEKAINCPRGRAYASQHAIPSETRRTGGGPDDGMDGHTMR